MPNGNQTLFTLSKAMIQNICQIPLSWTPSCRRLAGQVRIQLIRSNFDTRWVLTLYNDNSVRAALSSGWPGFTMTRVDGD